jgi:AcrR family transcriptional regulator
MRIKTEKRREAILAAASSVFEERGIEAASMAEIAARLGGSKATLYNYFASKDELLLAVVGDGISRSYLKPFEALVGVAPSRTTIARFAEQYLEMICAPEMLALLRLAQQAGRGELGPAVHRLGPGQGWALVGDYLGQAMTAGQLRNTAPALAAKQFRALLTAEWMQECLLGTRELPGPEERAGIAARALETFLRAYAAD